MNLILSPTSLSDLEEVSLVLQDAFGANEGAALVRLLQQLRRDYALTLALTARVGEELCGFVAFSPVSVETQPSGLPVEGLAPLGVKKAWQGQGVGSALVEEGLRLLRDAGTGAVVVLGAAGYYARFGFENALSHGITNEYGAKRDFQVLGLRGGSLAQLQGLASYAPAFAAL